MNNRRTKIIVNVLMTIFVILSYIRWQSHGIDGLIFHAIVGTIFAVLAVIHLYLNRKWLPAVAKTIKAGKASAKIKQQYIVDIILLVLWGIAIVTGFLAIPHFVNGTESLRVFYRLHAVTSRLGGVAILVHIFQHLGQIRSYLGIKKTSKVKS